MREAVWLHTITSNSDGSWKSTSHHGRFNPKESAPTTSTPTPRGTHYVADRMDPRANLGAL